LEFVANTLIRIALKENLVPHLTSPPLSSPSLPSVFNLKKKQKENVSNETGIPALQLHSFETPVTTQWVCQSEDVNQVFVELCCDDVRSASKLTFECKIRINGGVGKER
jgi:hypothetical protein